MTKKFTHALGVLLCLLVSTNALAQTINATVGGTVADATGALIPGVTVTATNTGTGIVNTVLTNESGAYQFAALQPGVYKVSAELPGFQTETFTDVQLGGAQQVRLNFTLQVAAAAGTSIEVTVAADTLLATSSNSIGTILPEYKVRDLPTVAGNVFNIVQNMPGVQRDPATGIFGYMAGGRLGDVNTTRDGVNVNDGRYENGAWSVVYTSPDLVEEVKVIVAPVDAETSRGSGQVSMVTRSGTNQFRGSVFWNNHNSALDANDWFNNRSGLAKSYDNRNQYGARLGGPIIKNKTFFFALFEGQRDLKKTQAAGLTLTDTAKAGIFRYWPGVDPANAASLNPSVDIFGRPVVPVGANTSSLADPTQPAAIGLFGSCTFRGAPVANCKTFSDANRTAISNAAFIQEELRRMPSPNQFTSNGQLNPDGLNTALIRFTRRQEGLDQTNGNGDEVDRDQYNLRIDHNFNSKHKLSAIATKEKTWGTATQAGLRAWPDAYDGLAVKRPYVYSIQLTSTLSNTLLNQLRLSKRASNNWQWGSANRGDAIGAEARKLHPVSNGIPFEVTFATNATIAGAPQTLQPFTHIGGFGRWREGINPMRSIGDDLSWTVRRHAFKMGVEWRRQESNGFNDPNYDPVATLGAGNFLVTPALDGTAFTGLTSNASTTARNLLYDLGGSVNDIRQAFGVVSATQTTLVGTPTVPNNREWNFQSELSAYFKDDWKFRPDLTLNLGIHYEYYGQPYEQNGLAARVIGDENTFRNVSCTSNIGAINSFYSTCSNLAQVQFVGKNSTHPDLLTNLKGNDLNNFAPSVGLAWNLPWFGKGKTVIRTGYGIAYEGALRNFINVATITGTVPGINLTGSNNNGLQYIPNTYTTLSTVSLPIPFPTGTPTSAPFVVPTTDRSLGITTYNHASPYTQNWNFEIQREVAKNTTVEVRYIGTKGTKLWGQINLNSIDALAHNRELFNALLIARAGGESPLLDTLLQGTTFSGAGVVNGTTLTGAGALRASTATATGSTGNVRTNLANGAFGAVMNVLNLTNTGVSLPPGVTATGSVLRRNGFPDNYFVASPQYSSVNIDGNNANSTYHALQMQFTRRLSHGFTNTTTYTWSKALGLAGITVLNAPPAPNNAIDPSHFQVKGLQSVDHKHQITANATYELPFGTEHFLLGNAPGWIQNVVSKWQLGGIFNFQTGPPLTLTTSNSTITGNNNANPDIVGKIPSDFGKITKVADGINYFSGYTQVTDPGFVCTASTTACNTLAAGYSNKAIQDPKGNIFLVNPQPGTVGNLGYTTLRGPKALFLDMNLVKRFKITETKQFEFRIDALNILNRPNFAAPSVNIDNTGFGVISSLLNAANNLGSNGGMRSFVINSRLNF
jgi:hypothetical protein